MKLKISVLRALLINALLLSIIGTWGNSSLTVQAAFSSASEEIKESEGETQQGKEPAFDWRNEKWKVEKNAEEGHFLYAAEYFTNVVNEQNHYSRSVCKAWRNNLYALNVYYQKNNDEYSYTLSSYNSLTGAVTSAPLSVPVPEEYADCKILVVDFEIQNEKEWVFFLQIWPQEDDSRTLAYLAVHMTTEGEVLSWLDLCPMIAECGEQLSDIMRDQMVYVNRQGYYFLNIISWEGEPENRIGYRKEQIFVLDPDGKYVGEFQPAHSEFPSYTMKTPDGVPVFLWDNGSLMTYDTEQDMPVQLLESMKIDLRSGDHAILLTENGYLYYVDGQSQLNRCNLRSGQKEVCLRYGRLGLSGDGAKIFMAEGPEGEPVILAAGGEVPIICRLSTQEPEITPLNLVSMTSDCSFLESSAAQFSRSDVEHPLYVETPAGDVSDYRDRKITELISGEGADLYYLSGADLQSLYEKGVLADLSQILPAETVEALYPGVLDGGIRNGQLVGLAPQAHACTMLAAQSYWAKETWTLEEMLDLLDDNPQMQYPIICTEDNYLDGNKLLRLLLQDLEDTPFLNLQKSTCDFDNSLFVRTLELAKRYEDRPLTNTAEDNLIRDLIAEENYIAMIMEPAEFYFFNRNMAALKDRCHVVGFPAEKGSGNYWQSDYYLVVNKNSEYPERAFAYLEYLFSAQFQDTLSDPVRSDLLNAHIIEASWDQEHPLQYKINDTDYQYLETRSDGSFWQEEYEAVMAQCELPADTSYIQEIIFEEAGSYFSGSKEVQTVVDLIQNRIQLYLNENASITQGKGNILKKHLQKP